METSFPFGLSMRRQADFSCILSLITLKCQDVSIYWVKLDEYDNQKQYESILVFILCTRVSCPCVLDNFLEDLVIRRALLQARRLLRLCRGIQKRDRICVQLFIRSWKSSKGTPTIFGFWVIFHSSLNAGWSAFHAQWIIVDNDGHLNLLIAEQLNDNYEYLKHASICNRCPLRSFDSIITKI